MRCCLKEVCFDGFSDGRVILSQGTFPSNLEKIVFPEGLTDQDVKDKMGLEFFPVGTKLYSSTELLPHNYDYTSEPDGLQHYLKCTACDDIKSDSYTENIPPEIIYNIAKDRYFIQISLSHSGEFGLTAVFSIDFGKDKAGLYAALYYYNNDNPEYICKSEISSDGIAELTFTHASDYLIVIDEKAVCSDNRPDSGKAHDPIPAEINDKAPPPDNSNDSDSKEENPKTGELGQPWTIMFICSIMTIVRSLFLKNKKKKTE